MNLVGIDEVGRGALAGPVIACALANVSYAIPVKDSKSLSPKKRSDIAKKIRLSDAIFSFGECTHAEIDSMNIHHATLEAMKRAVYGISCLPSKVCVDGCFAPILDKFKTISVETIIKGDQKIEEIMAASILAKVYRDNLMNNFHTLYPSYGFNRNKGYGTREHIEALKVKGPSPIHRLTFSGVIQ